jgi:hypothetical protein
MTEKSGSDDGNDGKVGYRRPPMHSRFQPGRSGNPKGRRKGMANLQTDLRDELSESIRVREGGRDLKISKQRAILKALVSKALSGDARAANVVLGLVSKLFESETPTEPMPSLTAEDQAVLKRFLARHMPSETPET